MKSSGWKDFAHGCCRGWSWLTRSRPLARSPGDLWLRHILFAGGLLRSRSVGLTAFAGAKSFSQLPKLLKSQAAQMFPTNSKNNSELMQEKCETVVPGLHGTQLRMRAGRVYNSTQAERIICCGVPGLDKNPVLTERTHRGSASHGPNMSSAGTANLTRIYFSTVPE